MNIRLKNKFLYFKDYRIKCAIGKRGITSKKVEGDRMTPKGSFRLKSIFYRKDRIFKIKSSLKKNVIRKNMGWCDDPSSKYYNKIIKFPFDKSAEQLWKRNNIYDIIVIIDYNLRPVIRNKGSAIFLHVAKKKYKPTQGCISVSKRDMYLLIKKINNRTKIIIN
tara:strand:+ start:1004 stop:1495 length:492 start_codon:yes stop_codon:yes gene_type:complete